MDYDKLLNDDGFYLYKDDSFNTISFSMIFEADNSEKDNAIIRILVDFLFKTTKTYKTEEELKSKLNDLYDSGINIELDGKDNHNIIEITADIVSYNVVEDYSKEFNGLLHDVIFNPDFTNYKLLEEVKKEYLVNKLGTLSDPDTVAIKNLYNKLYSNIPYFYSTDINYIKKITESITMEDLKRTYYKILSNFKYGLVFGNITDEQFKEFRNAIPFSSSSSIIESIKSPKLDVSELEISDHNISESIIYVVYSVEELTKEMETILNNILNNVLVERVMREKMDLVYYCRVFFDTVNNYIIFESKIAKENKEKYLKAINIVFKYLSNKIILKDLLNRTRNTIDNELYILSEDKYGMIDYLDECILYNQRFDDFVDSIKAYKPKDVKNCIKTLKKEMVFLYKGDKDE